MNRKKKIKTSKPECYLTEDEICRLIGTAKNARDQALIALLYGFGARIGELKDYKLLNFPMIKKVLKSLSVKAGIKKRVHPHLLRHSRIVERYRKDL